jgi:hypothetical protein
MFVPISRCVVGAGGYLAFGLRQVEIWSRFTFPRWDSNWR